MIGHCPRRINGYGVHLIVEVEIDGIVAILSPHGGTIYEIGGLGVTVAINIYSLTTTPKARI